MLPTNHIRLIPGVLDNPAHKGEPIYLPFGKSMTLYDILFPGPLNKDTFNLCLERSGHGAIKVISISTEHDVYNPLTARKSAGKHETYFGDTGHILRIHAKNKTYTLEAEFSLVPPPPPPKIPVSTPSGKRKIDEINAKTPPTTVAASSSTTPIATVKPKTYAKYKGFPGHDAVKYMKDLGMWMEPKPSYKWYVPLGWCGYGDLSLWASHLPN